MFARRLPFVMIVVLALLITTPLRAGRIVTEDKSVELTDEKDVSVEIDFGIGDLFVTAGDPGEIVTAEGHYDSRKFDYEFDYRKRGEHGDLYFDVSTRGHTLSNFDSEDNEWRFEFTDRVPLDLTIDIGASDCEFRLGGLMISHLDLDIGAADCDISFDEPNKCTLERIIVDAGASSVYIDKLGNARFDIFEFDGGVGSYELDFSGEFDFDAEAEISVGIGSVDIIIPAGVGVRLSVGDGFLSSVDFPERKFKEIDDDLYESLNWDDAHGHLEIELDVGLGSADISIGR
jgi:hypothetical protein